MGKVKETAAAMLTEEQRATLRSAEDVAGKPPASAPAHGLRLWNKLQTTDPQFTKGFKRPGFSGTMIDPTWRMKIMTETFGPVGLGWGWDEIQQQITTDCVFIQIRAWYMLDGVKLQAGAQWGGNVLYNTRTSEPGKQFPNDEAFKMAATDALGKSLLSIGLASDVYLGFFDDAKYRDDADAVYDKKNREAQRAASEAKRGRTDAPPADRDGSRAVPENTQPIMEGDGRKGGHGEEADMTDEEWTADECRRFGAMKTLNAVKAEWQEIHQGVVDLAEVNEDCSQRIVSAYQEAVTRCAKPLNTQPAE
jgi:hypothetical protein